MGKGVSVDLSALTTFAATVGKSADANYTSGTTQAAEMGALTQTMRSASGAPETEPMACTAADASTFWEAQQFTVRHDVMTQSMSSFLDDSLKGLVALGAGAETAAVRYAGTDEANAALLKAGHFDKDHPFTSMALPLTGRADVTDSGVTGAFTPTGKGQELFTTSAPTSSTTAPVTTTKPVPGQTQDTYDQQVAQDKAAIQDGTDPSSGDDLDDSGTTIGSGDTAINVPADSGQMPLPLPKLTMPVTN